MATEEDTPDVAEETPKSSGGGLLLWMGAAVIAAGAGFAIPFLLPDSFFNPVNAEAPERSYELPPSEKAAFVSFGEVVCNLDEGRLNRYLRISITLQVNESKQEDVAKRIETKRFVLKNWLLSHMSDKALEDIRGAIGQNRLRREIRDRFNAVLFDDGVDHIHDVLFEEFNVQ